jgi:hypothetical protein
LKNGTDAPARTGDPQIHNLDKTQQNQSPVEILTITRQRERQLFDALITIECKFELAAFREVLREEVAETGLRLTTELVAAMRRRERILSRETGGGA